MSIILFLCALSATAAATPIRRALVQQDAPLLQPHVITIERLEQLLRRAGEIFAPMHEDSLSSASEPEPQLAPHQYMLPPTEQPYNFYLPLFDYEDPKMDAKSRRLAKIAPPKLQQERNYYADKPKKTPKKFDAAAKHVNLKWLNTYEQAVGGQAPKAIYLEQDERNRINFDDSFFAVDMHVKSPDNQHQDDQAEDDLMAAPAHANTRWTAVN
ncbi:CG13154 [Drosophila busckii]|uniref:CG13154 n=1 Tax=Drosophila busckii TaxID=30019 RepID=A0A0M3QV17_DROBS|nr:uncharacterized protein LOC108596946 [Drosophila busckii]ALC41603.1 CG13154 [Drosophila busckii]